MLKPFVLINCNYASLFNQIICKNGNMSILTNLLWIILPLSLGSLFMSSDIQISILKYFTKT